LVLSRTGSINLGFIQREDLLLCSSYLPLGVPNWAVIYTPSSNFLASLSGIEEEEAPTSTTRQAIFLAPLPGRKRISARGVSHIQSFTLLLFCFILFLLVSFYQKYKNIVPL
jgi:hypothetical protein